MVAALVSSSSQSSATAPSAARPRWRDKSAVRASLVLWAVGYVLAATLSALVGAGPLPQNLLVYAPLWALGVGQSIGLLRVWVWLEDRHGVVRWPVIAVLCLIAAGVQALADAQLLLLNAPLNPDIAAYKTAMNGPRLARGLILYGWTFCLNITLFWAVGSERQAWLAEERAAEAEIARRQTELAALRLQLNPHFLFNSLNAVSTLVLDRRPEEADAMLMKLANFLRASLLADPARMSTVAREVETLKAYLEIERVRFADGLVVHFQFDPAVMDAQMPSLLLQPLVENAIKYAVAGAEGPVQVNVSGSADADTLVLEVSDNGAGETASYGTGIGHDNIRARLHGLYGDEASLLTRRTEAGFAAVIRLPM